MSRPGALNWESATETHPGKVRRTNEDAVLSRPDIGLWAVADGMGGHSGGAEASQLVIEALNDVSGSDSLEQLSAEVEAALHGANARLTEGDREDISGSTVAVFICIGRKGRAIWAGDSRIYRYRDGHLQQLSRDHSQVEEWIAQGLIDREAARYHPTSNIITRAIGAQTTLEPEFVDVDAMPGDRFLICSDGLYNEISDIELSAKLADPNCEVTVKQLLSLALDRGARDNISVIVASAA